MTLSQNHRCEHRDPRAASRRLARICLSTAVAFGLGAGAQAAVNINQQGLTGAWANAATSGQGMVLELYPDLLSAGDHFALEVRGDSMIEAGILDGDIALIRKSEAADTGDIVVALIDDEEATLKRFRRRGASIALEPANTAYEVRILPPNRVRIQGKLVGLFRRY